MNHHFNTDIAEKYGIEEAILFENIYYWCIKNKANNHNLFDGNYWTYNSVKAFSKMFKYMTPKKIISALKNLEESGLIVTGCYNENKYDRTKWYAVTEFGHYIYQNREMEDTKKENGNSRNGQVNVTDINQIINTDINTDGEHKNMIPPPQEPSDHSVNDNEPPPAHPSDEPPVDFSSPNVVGEECLSEIQECHKRLFRRWVGAKLPLSKSSASSYFVFSCRELKAALECWSGRHYTASELEEALDNYISLAELIRTGGSWMRTVGGFEQFARHTSDYLDGNFSLDRYRKGGQQETQEDVAERTDRLLKEWGMA